jgi:putative PIN family toxin of toxin-antitoxin system
MKVTLDTNVLVSGTFWSGDSFKVLEHIEQKKIINVISQDILQEYKEVLQRKEIISKIENKNLVVSNVSKHIESNSLIVYPRNKITLMKEDSDDTIILSCAKEGKADYIITNDNHLLKLKEFEKIKIVTPSEFLKLLN